jgi:CheY-like chemotaxis protein
MRREPGLTILIVDDEAVSLESLRRGLKSKGYQVLEALSAQHALDLLRQDGIRVDVVLTDYAMPEMDGMELVRQIRERHGNLAVIMMTAYGQKELDMDALRDHCDSFIEKPFTLDRLLIEIERAKANHIHHIDCHYFT